MESWLHAEDRSQLAPQAFHSAPAFSQPGSEEHRRLAERSSLFVQLQSAVELSKARGCLSQTLELDVLRSESLVRIIIPLRPVAHEWIDELRQQVFGRMS